MKIFNLTNITNTKLNLDKKQKLKINLIKRLQLKLNFLNKKQDITKNLIKFNKNQCNLKRETYNQFSLKLNKKISYVFIINIHYSNLFFNVTNNLNEQICTFSVGYLRFKSLDKITQKYTLLQVLKSLIKKTKSYKNIAIHFKSLNYVFNKLILNFLKNFYYIQLIKFYNYLPHNGCRQKKKRRK